VPPPTTRTERTRGYKKKERTRKLLIGAAVEVMAEQGEAFSISDVVARAGVSNGTFYNYFTDRDALMGAVVPEMVSSFAADSDRAVIAEDPALRFATISAMALRGATASPEAVHALLRFDAIQRVIMVDGPLSHLRSDIAAGVDARRFSVVDEDAAIDVVVGALLTAMRRIIDEGPSLAHERGVLEHLLRSLGLSSPEATTIAEQALAS